LLALDSQLLSLSVRDEIQPFWQRARDGHLEQFRRLGLDNDNAIRLEKGRDLPLRRAGNSPNERVGLSTAYA
jgi:hypothetical protein